MSEKTTNPVAEKPAETPKAPVAEKPAEPAVEMTLRERLDADMKNESSNLRNQVSVSDIVDFQLLSNTPAQVVAAMTGKTIEELKNRADEIGVTLKGSLAGSMQADS